MLNAGYNDLRKEFSDFIFGKCETALDRGSIDFLLCKSVESVYVDVLYAIFTYVLKNANAKIMLKLT